MDFRTEGNVWKEDEAERIRGSGDDGRHTGAYTEEGGEEGEIPEEPEGGGSFC